MFLSDKLLVDISFDSSIRCVALPNVGLAVGSVLSSPISLGMRVRVFLGHSKCMFTGAENFVSTRFSDGQVFA